MRGNYLPRIGPANGAYYLNWSYWENDLRASAVVLDERANIAVEQMYQLSSYKNLFSGVVTVNDHFPHEFNEPFIPGLPIRVLRDYTLAHECSSFDLKWGDGIQIEHRRAVERDHPFITHLEEGFDPEIPGRGGDPGPPGLPGRPRRADPLHRLQRRGHPSGRGGGSQRGLVPRLQPVHVQRHLQGAQDAGSRA